MSCRLGVIAGRVGSPVSDAPAALLVLTPSVAQHMRLALASHGQWCRKNAVAMPAELSALLEVLPANARQRPPFRADPEPPGDAAAMTFAEAARALGCSTRTVSRLVGGGRLAAVGVGSGKRIPAVEVERFVSARGAA
jgi:excisionase family DNA binding protein